MGLLIVPVILMVVGMVIAVGGFLFSAINMATAVDKTGSVRAASREFGRFGRMFKRHLAAMAIMAVGGLFALIGLIYGVYLVLPALLSTFFLF